MKKQIYTLAVVLIMGFTAQAQVGIGTPTPSPSSMLDITSTTKGLLMPRMTTGQRTAIPSPATGLQVYDTTTNSFWYFNGTIWVNSGASVAQDLRFIGSNNHITQDAGIGNNGTSVGSGSNVIGIGAGTLIANTTGSINLGIGTSTLAANTSGGGNTGIGTQALTANTTGGFNTALGYLALQNNTTGSNNIAAGVQAGNNITTGGNNIAIGNGTAVVFPTGNNQLNIANTIYGTGLTGGGAGFIGIGTGSPNAQLQLGNTVVNRKLVLFDAFNNDHQFYGLGVNSGSMRYQVDGTGSSHIFYAAASGTASNELMRVRGDGNVGIGTSTPGVKLDVTGAAIRVFNNNSASTITAQNGTSDIRLQNNNGPGYVGSVTNHTFEIYTNNAPRITTLGNGNVGVGQTNPQTRLQITADQAAYSQISQLMITGTDPNKQLSVGYNTTADKGYIQSSHAGVTWTDLILQPNAGNVGIGTTTPSTLLHVNGVITATKIQGPSDFRFKKNIKPIDNALDKVLKLNGYTYDWKDASEFPGQSLGKGHDMGVIAQEVEKQFPEAVTTNADGYKAVSYTELVPALIEAIKTLKAEIDELKKRSN